jgi:hypothetical protein
LYDWIGESPVLTLNGNVIEGKKNEQGTVLYADNLHTGDVLTITFPMETVEKKEFFAGAEYTEFWRGGDMIDLLPRGDHIRLYQRDNTIPKYYPLPDEIEYTGVADRGPTQQQQQKK